MTQRYDDLTILWWPRAPYWFIHELTYPQGDPSLREVVCVLEVIASHPISINVNPLTESIWTQYTVDKISRYDSQYLLIYLILQLGDKYYDILIIGLTPSVGSKQHVRMCVCVCVYVCACVQIACMKGLLMVTCTWIWSRNGTHHNGFYIVKNTNILSLPLLARLFIVSLPLLARLFIVFRVVI